MIKLIKKICKSKKQWKILVIFLHKTNHNDIDSTIKISKIKTVIYVCHYHIWFFKKFCVRMFFFNCHHFKFQILLKQKHFFQLVFIKILHRAYKIVFTDHTIFNSLRGAMLIPILHSNCICTVYVGITFKNIFLMRWILLLDSWFCMIMARISGFICLITRNL